MLFHFIRWRMEKANGRVVMSSLGHNEDELRFLLGNEYQGVQAAIGHSSEAPAQANTSSPVTSVTSASSPLQPNIVTK